MILNVRDFGAVGNGITDDRVAIQDAIDAAVANNNGGIHFPPGTYRVSRVTILSGRWSLDLNGVKDFRITGDGPKSVVRLVDTSSRTGDWHVFILRNNCQRVNFSDLVIDGNRTGLTEPDEQSHGIEVEPGTEDLVIDKCILRECHGDGMRLLGSSGANVKRLRIQNSLFQKNKRSGIAIQRALEQITISNCVFDATVSDQSIDFEPSGSDGPAEFIIHGCIINHTNRTAAVTLSGISGQDRLVRCKLTDNIIRGQIFSTDVNQLTIQNNLVVVNDAENNNRIPIQIQRGGDSILITGNLVVNDNINTEAVISLSEVNNRQVSRALVSDNLCFARAGNGIQCIAGDDIAIQNNMIVATETCSHGIFLRSSSSSMDNISVRDNDITVRNTGRWRVGIRIAASSHPIKEFSIVGNSVRTADSGISFEGPAFQQTPFCSLNRIADDVLSPLQGIGALPFDSILVAGATSRGGTAAGSGSGRFITGLGDPNNKIVGNIGDIFQRLDGSAAATLYVKEAGNNSNTGWVPK